MAVCSGVSGLPGGHLDPPGQLQVKYRGGRVGEVTGGAVAKQRTDRKRVTAPGAEGGDLYLTDDTERRFYCVQFRDGRQVAVLKSWEEGELRPLEGTELCADA